MTLDGRNCAAVPGRAADTVGSDDTCLTVGAVTDVEEVKRAGSDGRNIVSGEAETVPGRLSGLAEMIR